jgi:hypothetical protein
MNALLLLLVLFCGGCSGDYARERPVPQTATDLHRYCLDYPKDSACQGPASK